MRMIGLLLLVVIGLMVVPTVYAVQPIQQSNKIFLDPFYRASMTSNTNYTYSFTVSPPDSISRVSSAIISFDIYITPTVTFTLWVNNRSCNTPNYTISTTYASAGQSRVSFDCSNVVSGSGTYQVTLRPTSANTGAVNGWIDLTYVNNPRASVDVHGTEYRPNEPAKVWLQLLNNSGDDISTAICRVDIYTPDGQEYIEDATMTNQLHDGIYYYNLYAPATQGVYPAIAKCYYDATEVRFNASSSLITNGTATGGTTYLNTFADDNTYHDVDEVLVGSIWRLDLVYNFTGVTQNGTSNTLGYQIEWHGRWDNSPAGDNPVISLWNFTSSSWTPLQNTIQSAGAGDQYISNSFNTPLANLTQIGVISPTGTVSIRIQDNTTLTDGTKTKLKTDYVWFVIDYTTQQGYWEEVKGASELHVNDWFTYYGSTAEQVWNYTNRTLTEFNITVNATATIDNSLVADAVWNYSGTVSPNLLSQFASNVWSFANRTLTSFGNLVTDIWSAPSRNLTYYPNQTDLTNYSEIQEIVANYSNNITAQEVWEYTNRSLTEFNFIVDVNLNATQIADAVWNYGTRNLTFYEVNNITAQDVWEYTNRTLTLYQDTFNYSELTNAVDSLSVEINEVDSEVWNYSTRNLTYYEVTQVNETAIAVEVWQYGNKTLDYYEVNNITAQEIWNFANRNLTYYENFGDQTNYTLIQDLITQYGNDDNTNYTLIGDLITQYGNEDNTNYTEIANIVTQFGNDDNTNYTLIQEIVTQYGNDDNTNYTLIGDLIVQYSNNISAQDIWEYTNRNLTYYEDVTNYTLVQELITNYGNNDVTNYTLISDMVWSATTRTLTDFNFTVDVNQTAIADAIWTYVDRTLTNYTDTTNYTLIEELINSYSNNLTAQQIWEYSDRNLTYYPASVDMTNYTLINEGVWSYANRNLTFFPAQVDLTNYTLVGESVWTALNRTLTEFNFEVSINNTQLVEDVWGYYNRTLTETADPFNYSYMQELVWNFTDRELTNIDWSTFNVTVNTTVDYNDIAQTVWGYVNRTLTDYNQTAQVDLTNYTYISEVVWNATTRTLTDFNFTVTANVNVTEIADAVWTSVNRTLTDYNQTSQLDLTDYALIQTMVWNATVRTLTDYDHTDMTDYDLIQDMVWNATVRELTYYPTTNISLTNESIQAIGDAVWQYNGTINSNILTQVAETVQCYLSNLFEVNNGEWAIDIKSC